MRAMYYQPINIRFIEGPDSNFLGNLLKLIESKEEDNKRKKHIEQEVVVAEEEVVLEETEDNNDL